MYNRRYKTKTLTNHPINKIIKAIEALTVFQTTITTSLSLFKESEHGRRYEATPKSKSSMEGSNMSLHPSSHHLSPWLPLANAKQIHNYINIFYSRHKLQPIIPYISKYLTRKKLLWGPKPWGSNSKVKNAFTCVLYTKDRLESHVFKSFNNFSLNKAKHLKR